GALCQAITISSAAATGAGANTSVTSRATHRRADMLGRSVTSPRGPFGTLIVNLRDARCDAFRLHRRAQDEQAPPQRLASVHSSGTHVQVSPLRSRDRLRQVYP